MCNAVTHMAGNPEAWHPLLYTNYGPAAEHRSQRLASTACGSMAQADDKGGVSCLCYISSS